MKKLSIKVKMTILYTTIIALILGIVMICGLFYMNQLELSKSEEQLQENVDQFVGDLSFKKGSYEINSDVDFYDEGIMYAIYDKNGVLLHGVLPQEFPTLTKLSTNNVRTVSNNEKHWMVYDTVYNYGNNQTVWIRGIDSIHDIEDFMASLRIFMLVAFLVLVIFVGIISYRMLQRALKPVDSICKSVDQIRDGNNLTNRLSIPEKKDEMYKLAMTFNDMFQRLEESFENEKQFTSDVSHELRTPIAVLISQCEYMLENEQLSEDDKMGLSIILRQANRMSKLISQLLMIARSENGTLRLSYEEIELHMLIEMVSEELEEKATKRGIEITIDGAKEIYISGDQSLLMRVFLNLIDNGITYGTDNGWIHIHLEKQEHNAVISIEDNGIGISKTNLEKIWNRLYQVEQSRNHGMGLGLSMVQWIVKAHHGTIHVESELGKGSKFIVHLPFTL
ncbi:MAG: HAMP domain-containing sensor histidine kinase [Anaerostipes sp.]|nr:HAMP domain-containing sensor histidine kinase [Anaerostipes sp.]